MGAVIGGFLMEHGPIRVLIQPSEILIIGGAALGTLLAANPLHTLKGVIGGILQVVKGSKFSKKRYLDSLKMMYDMFNKIRRDGPNSVENDIEAPDKSKFFAAYPDFVKDHHLRDFVCDTMRMALMGGVEPFDVDQMIEADMDVHSHLAEQSVTALSTVADSLPGLGIVAAVLGVVMTMSALGGPPEEIGKKVAAALVGTFLGILMCYGMVGPDLLQPVQAFARGARIPARAARHHDRLHERHLALAGGGDGAAGRARSSAAELRRVREALQTVRRPHLPPPERPREAQPKPRPRRSERHARQHHSRSSSSAKAVTPAITAAPGKSPMPIS